eukprot:m.748887 g.748887  ORF g.748887 m.748887 type:complete len:59 (-) comp23150_c1_seq1:2-178(-)
MTWSLTWCDAFGCTYLHVNNARSHGRYMVESIKLRNFLIMQQLCVRSIQGLSCTRVHT